MPRRYIPFVIIVITLIVGGGYFYHVESSYIEGMKEASGQVVDFEMREGSTVHRGDHKESWTRQAIVEFEANNASHRFIVRAFSYPKFEMGEGVDVYYSEGNPNKARVKRLDQVYFFTLICLIVLAYCAIFSLINFAVYKIRGRPLS
ncbi:DUF3592 domain-containing protein [Marinimicrobium locisalis]|uniref:DUF3592 domain-containing protein n=1 Tax=Marinimicrobium locisalis TaxID=546022 RepID=UPI0032215F34